MTPRAASGKVPVLFVSDHTTNAVWLFDASNLSAPPIGEITDHINYPGAMAVDAAGNLYLVNYGGIDVFAPGSLHRQRKVDIGRQIAESVAVAADGTLATFTERSGRDFAVLLIFDKGSSTATRKIRISLDGNLFFPRTTVAIDSADDVFASVGRYPKGPNQLLKFAPGSTKGVDTGLPASIGMGFDAAGNLYLGDGDGSTGWISVYPPGATQPAYTITNGLTSPAYLTVLPDGTLFVPNTSHYVGGQPTNGNVVEFAPGGFNPDVTLTNADDTNSFGTAYRPAAP